MPTAVAKTSVTEEPPAGIDVLEKDAPQEARLSEPANFINRELSWLEFNRRVLEEAQDPTQPLIERVKFLTIFSSNLDEFFEIRVGLNVRCGKMNFCLSWRRTGFTCVKWRNSRQNAQHGRIVIFSRKFFRCLLPWRWMPAIRFLTF